jgi:hypothetical protein
MANLTDLVQERLTGRGASYRIRTPLDRFGLPATRALGELYRLGVLGVLARTAVTAATASREPKGAYSYQAVRPTPRPARPGPRGGSATPAPVAPSHPQDDVTAMAARGVPIDRIEDYIDRLPLEDDELSALWLLAWSQRPSAETALRGPR